MVPTAKNRPPIPKETVVMADLFRLLSALILARPKGVSLLFPWLLLKLLSFAFEASIGEAAAAIFAGLFMENSTVRVTAIRVRIQIFTVPGK